MDRGWRITNGSRIPDDHYCWQRPEDMNYPRKTPNRHLRPGTSGEWPLPWPQPPYFPRQHRLLKETHQRGRNRLDFAPVQGQKNTILQRNPFIEPYYNSTGY
ncbi:hypothetical protein BUALT_Bualt06G0008300 [Buddleja alternifolia]|uniref:Uncharacterized protein n=1 Tax=Buddleja alternifolia TaxID=168488 RepID=A0AAV6XBY4_9LAMI|nr:hypothetical protein BUALT_Bualt06G0008300 [Buddleja alternifolia]